MKRHLIYGFGILAVGLMASVFAILFRGSLSLLNQTVFGVHTVVEVLTSLTWWQRALFPAIGGLLGGMVSRAIGPTGGGVGDVMEAVVLGKVNLSLRSTVLKSLASWLAIATGGSLGREGPLIQFGGAAGKTVGQVLKLTPGQIRILIAAGTAAGFAAAYNTPFAAVLFVVEVVIGVVVVEAIWPVLIATVLATAVTRFAVGPGPLYGEHTFSMESNYELFAYAALGVVVAFGAQGFMRALSLGERLFKNPRLPMPWRPALGGLLAGLVIAVMPEIAGNGFEPLSGLISGHYAWGFVLFLMIGKVFATTASVSSGSPGGVFTPTLLVGGSLGFLFATGLSLILPPGTISLGGYALVGMAAATAATTHAPILACVMVFELTGDYAIVLPLMIATAIATAVSRFLREDSIYMAELKEKGHDWELTLEGRVHD